MQNIVITGAAGQLGNELVRQLGTRAVALDRQSLDITDAEAVRFVLAKIRPDAVINAASYTKVDQAEQEPDRCREVNVEAVATLADVCRRLDCPLLHISTDYVFGADRSRRTPYRETDPPGPLGVYARSKLEGEQRAAEWQKHYIVRTCGLYGHPGPHTRTGNFVRTMLRLGAEKDHLRVVDDQWCTPSFVPHVAAAVIFLLEHAPFGTYHVVNSGETTWCRFAREIFHQAGLHVEVEPITTEQFGAAADRPRYSVLDTSKYRALGGPPLPHWREALAEFLATQPTEPS